MIAGDSELLHATTNERQSNSSTSTPTIVDTVITTNNNGFASTTLSQGLRQSVALVPAQSAVQRQPAP